MIGYARVISRSRGLERGLQCPDRMRAGVGTSKLSGYWFSRGARRAISSSGSSLLESALVLAFCMLVTIGAANTVGEGAKAKLMLAGGGTASTMINTGPNGMDGEHEEKKDEKDEDEKEKEDG